MKAKDIPLGKTLFINGVVYVRVHLDYADKDLKGLAEFIRKEDKVLLLGCNQQGKVICVDGCLDIDEPSEEEED